MSKPTRHPREQSILYWPAGRYVPADHTNIRATFERVRRELAEAERRKVTPIKREKR